jgi:hypothetical protein
MKLKYIKFCVLHDRNIADIEEIEEVNGNIFDLTTTAV